MPAARPAQDRTGPTALDVRGLAGGHQRQRVFGPLDFTLEAGRSLAVLGGNGAGKSTLLSILAGRERAMAGRVERPSGHVAYLPQQSALAADAPVRVRELVETGLRARLWPWGRRDRRDAATVDQALDDTGLSGLADRFVATLSGGERRRALLARLLAEAPSVLILDEPLAGVDLAGQKRFLERLARWRAEGRIVVAALHEPGLAAHFDFCLRLSGPGPVQPERAGRDLLNGRMTGGGAQARAA